MGAKEIKDSFLKLKKNFRSVTEDLNNYLRMELKVIVDLYPSFGSETWVIKTPDKRIYIDLHATGQGVIESYLSTSANHYFEEDFLKPKTGNSFDLTEPLGLENLIEKIKMHLNGILVN